MPPSTTVPSSPAERGHKKLSTAAIVAFAAAVFFLLLLCLVFCFLRRRRSQPSKSPKHSTAMTRAIGAVTGGGEGTSSSKDDLTSGAVEGERSKLVFVNNIGAGAAGSAAYNFDLEDLLRASAEVLGKGSVPNEVIVGLWSLKRKGSMRKGIEGNWEEPSGRGRTGRPAVGVGFAVDGN